MKRIRTSALLSTCEYELSKLDRYLIITETYIKTLETDIKIARENWGKAIAEGFKNLSREEGLELFGSLFETGFHYDTTFVRSLRNSFLFLAWSSLELEMERVCRTLKAERKLSDSWKDLNEGTLENFKRYCRLAGLSYQFNDSTWQEIHNYYMVRNCIVHNGGLIKLSKQLERLRAYATRKNVVSEDEIALTHQFCGEVIRTMRKFLGMVLEDYAD